MFVKDRRNLSNDNFNFSWLLSPPKHHQFLKDGNG